MFHLRITTAVLVASIAFAQEMPAPPVAIDRPLQLPSLILGDLKATWTAPAAWTSDEWTKLSMAALAVVGVSLALDRPTARAVERMDRTSYDPWGKRLDTLGGLGTIAIAGGAYVGGLLFEQPKMREFGADAALSMLIAQLVVTIPVKYLAGRSRPIDDQGPYHFKPLRGGFSFPSGHASRAFALATVLSEYADNPWISGLAYGGAALVGVSRLEQREHFVSDVVAGALIGTLSAKAVMLRHSSLRGHGAKSRLTLTVAPSWINDSAGLMVCVKF
ncbi:MAG: phosphatase PAP2 family protein [Holophaga sp.]|nr:phosphatase PAP2 family protein [Holophaga sp.]